MVIDQNHYLWKGLLKHFPQNIAEAPPGMKQWFVDALNLKDSVFYTWGVPQDEVMNLIKRRAANAIKDTPPDPFFVNIYVAAQAATCVFILVVGCASIAKL
jgi:hypothetical protein